MLKCSTSLSTVTRKLFGSIKKDIRQQICEKSGSCRSAKGNKFKLPQRLGDGAKSIWVEYSQFAAEHKPAANLGLGFPNFLPPEHIRKFLIDVSKEPNQLLHQYTRGYGHPRLVKGIAKLFSPLIGRKIDPMNEVLVTCGAFEALNAAILGHVDDGDEVIIIEPFFDCYDFLVKSAGGVPRFIALKPKKNCRRITKQIKASDFVLDENELYSLFNKKTKMIIVNTPHNPLGKVFTKKELQLIADLCKKHNVLCVSDEVYEWMVYEGNEHVRIASLPGMWERTITIGSAGKTFSVTGWRTGWAYCPAALMRNLQVVHQNCVFTCNTPMQEALGRIIEFELRRDSPQSVLRSTVRDLTPKRNFMMRSLRESGFNPIYPDGGYFVVVDWSELEKKMDLSTEKDRYKDYKFTKKFAKEASVLAIPVTPFYSEEHKHLGEKYARFCFIKTNESLQLADKLMRKWSRCCF